MKTRLYAVIPEFKEVYLYKDMGMIPYTLQKDYGYECTIACYKKIIIPENFREKCKNLKFEQIHPKFHNKILDTIYYIVRKARNIDILNVYGLKIVEALLWGNIYKIFNCRGNVYLKLDIGYYNCEICENDNILKKNLKKALLRNIALVSAETQELADRISKLYKKNITYIPNGFSELGLPIEQKKLQKENVFLSVANFGTWPKASEILIESFAKSVSTHNWSLKLIGSVEVEFQEKIKEISDKYPDAMNKIEFVGEINDREKLSEEYQKAKVFILPSRKEGSPLVLVEAISNGCYIITTNRVAPAKDITENEKYGVIVDADNIGQLTNAIIEVCNCDFDWNMLSSNIKEYAVNRFNWTNICEKLIGNYVG